MKGRILCPECSHEFIAEAEPGVHEIQVQCPRCNHPFQVKVGSHCDPSEEQSPDECYWEEHGEPRKTSLSSMKPRTDKPMISSILLIIVVIIGFGSAVAPEGFLVSPLSLLSTVGISESAEIRVIDIQGQPVPDASIITPDGATYEFNSSGIVSIPDISLGRQTLTMLWDIKTKSVEIFVFPFTFSSYEIVVEDVPASATVTDAQGDLSWCSGILIILSVITFLGAISSMRRRHSDVALVCSIIGIFTIGFFFIGSILAIIAFILILYSKEEFDDGKKGKSF